MPTAESNTTKPQSSAPEQCPHDDDKFCVRCNDSGKVATDASCPARAQFAQKVKEREEAKQERRSRSRTRRRRRRRSRHPKLDSTAQPTSRSPSETRDSQFLPPPRVPSKVRLQPNRITYATAVTSLTELDTPATRTEAQIQLIEAAQQKDKEEFQEVLARIQQQISELQRQYNNRQKTRDGQIRALQRRLAAETEHCEMDMVGCAKRRQSHSLGRARCEAAESPAPTKQARQELPQRAADSGSTSSVPRPAKMATNLFAATASHATTALPANPTPAPAAHSARRPKVDFRCTSTTITASTWIRQPPLLATRAPTGTVLRQADRQ